MADTSQRITVSTERAGDKSRRRKELIIAVAMIFLTGVFSWVEIQYIGVNSLIFIVLLNVNFILLLVALLLVARNVVKLVLERRRNVLGSHLRSRLVLAFISLSLVPTLLMFFISVKFVQTSVDYWFRSQVENSMEQALEVGRSFYETGRKRIEALARSALEQIEANGHQWGGPAMDAFCKEKKQEYGVDLVGALDASHAIVVWRANDKADSAWESISPTLDWQALQQASQPWSTIWSGPGADMVLVLLPADAGYLVMGVVLGHGLSHRLNEVVHGVEEYKKLKILKHPLKVALYFIMGGLTLLIVFGSIWFGFRLTKELTAPIQALVEGAERIARGDLTVRLSDRASDELGVLVASFNKMAEDLESSRQSLTEKNRELEQRGRYMEAVLDNITAGVISLNSQGVVSTVNKAASSIINVERSRIAGHRPSELLYGDFNEMLLNINEHLRKNPHGQWQRQIDVHIDGQERKLLVNVVSLAGRGQAGDEPDGGGLVAVFEDITELETMQRLAAWREVARRIAHEIKNPLTPIKLSAQRLERRLAPLVDDPVLYECTSLIITQVEQLQNMVAEFSAFAKMPEVQLQTEDPRPIIEEVAGMFRVSHSDIAWTLDLEEGLPHLRLDKEAFRRVCLNILANAAEAITQAAPGGKGGEASVTARHVKERGVVRFTFYDNGPGLTAEERSRLFEPYFSRKKGGTGLGMTIVKSIINDHHGYVRVQDASVQGQGTAIIVELPVA